MRENRPAPASYISPLTGQASWARNAAMGATRSGDMGVAAALLSSESAACPAMRVNAAGAIRLTLIPCAELVVARLRVSPMTAALAVA